MITERLLSAAGLIIMMILAWTMSSNRKIINWRVIIGGLTLQFILALLILRTDLGRSFFNFTQTAVGGLIELSDEGAKFMFGDNFAEHFFAFKVLPTIIFISSLSALAFYWGILQKIVAGLAYVMQRVMGISGAESLVAAANIFCGQTEAPLLVKPYIKIMTRSELMVMMNSGMATVAGGVMAAYVGMGISAGHLMAASIMSAPAAILIAKLMMPETEKSRTMGTVNYDIPALDENAFAAACRGAAEGVKLAINVAAMLIAFIAIVALVNLLIGKFTGLVLGHTFSLQDILAVVFYPFAVMMGVPLGDCAKVAALIGERMVLNEFIAYVHLAELVKDGVISERATSITTYALCGFANFSSIAIQIGGIGELEPSRRADFAYLGMRAMFGATLACFMTACIASLLI